MTRKPGGRTRRRLAAGLAALAAAALGVAAAGQQNQNIAAAAAANVVPASYIIGPNDVLAMTVYGDPELTDSQMRVDTDGTVHTPYGSTPVHVAGMNPGGAQTAIAAELVRDQLAIDPKVQVTVIDPESHPITISGQGVRQPGTIQAIQPIHLLDALTRAGGLSDNSGAEITIVTHNSDGTLHEQKFSAGQVLAAVSPPDNPWLHGGEEIRVMPGGNAYLSGAVQTPGAYPLNDSDPLTVRKAMAKAHGLAPAAKAKDAQLIHHVGEPNQTETIINLPAIIAGTAPDVMLAANDMVYVPISGTKRAGLDALSRTLTVVTIVASELLVQ